MRGGSSWTQDVTPVTAGGEPGIAPDQELSGLAEVNSILDDYWANEKNGDKLWSTLAAKEAEFLRSAEARGLLSMARLAYAIYFGLSNSVGTSGRWSAQSIQFSGESGELIEFNVNEFRSFCDQIINMTCKNRPSFQAQAINTDYDSLAQVEASDSNVNYHFEQNYGERKEKEVVKAEGLYGKAYTHVEWDPDGGPDVEIDIEVPDPATGDPMPGKDTVKAGEFIVSRLYWWQVVCEPSRSEYDGHHWRMVVPERRSKWEMLARFPLYARQIHESNLVESDFIYRVPGTDPNALYAEDYCSIRIFYHLPGGAIPKGRKVTFVNQVMVDDTELPIDQIPVVDLMSCELHGTVFGISDMWNMIPLDQMQSQVLSDMATNIEAFGRPPLAVTEGTDIDLDALANGQKVIFVPMNAATPEAIKFPTIPDASWKIIELLRGMRQSISGLNAIARGDTSANVTSGAHAALYSSLAVDAQAPRASALDHHRERVGNIFLAYLKKYAQHPQLIAVAGVDERSYMQSFTGKDLAGVHRVVIKTVNPMMKTQAGRLSIVEMLRDWPNSPLSDPEQILELLTSGQMKPMYSASRVGLLRTKQENEVLLKGPEVQITMVPDPTTGAPVQQQTVPEIPVLMTDNVRTHLVAHLEVIASPAAKNPKIMAACVAHILDHMSVARTGDPYLAMILGNPPPQSAMPPGGVLSDGTGTKASDSTQNQASKAVGDPSDDSSASPSIPKAAEPPPQAATGS